MYNECVKLLQLCRLGDERHYVFAMIGEVRDLIKTVGVGI